MSIKNLIKKIFYQNFQKRIGTTIPILTGTAHAAGLLKDYLPVNPEGVRQYPCILQRRGNLTHRISSSFSFRVITFFLLTIFSIKNGVSGREEYQWTYNLEKGHKQFSAEMYNDALDSMKMAFKKNPRSFEAANIIAQISLIKKDIYSAEKYFLLSLEINDTQPDIHISMGRIDEYFQRDDSAMDHYKKSVSLNPENPQALINLSRIHYKRGQITEAERYFKLCYDKGISASSGIYANAEEMRKNNPSSAALEFKKAIEINPAHTAAYIGLADSYRQTGLYDKAIEIIEKLKSNKPDYTLTYIYLGNIYYNNKPDMKRRKYYIGLSVRNYEKAIELDPENPDIYFQLSSIYKQTGNNDRAAELELKGQDKLKNEK